MEAQASLLEQSVESTRKLAWYDAMIRKYTNMQNAVHDILELMNEQARVDPNAATILAEAYTLSLNKLETLGRHRQAHFEKHDRIMQRVLDGEE